MFQDGQRAPTLREYLDVLRRRKWLVLQALVLVPTSAVALSFHRPAVYEATSDVLVNRQNLAAGLSGINDPTVAFDANRLMQTQARLARVPEVARRVLRAAVLEDRSAGGLLANSSVSASEQTDILTFSVSDADPELAARLATEYARQFTLYREELDTAALRRARDAVEKQIAELRSAGDQRSALYQNLVDKEQQLRTMETLHTGRAVVVRPAGGAARIQTSPTRNGIIGAVLGLVLGIVLAFLVEALDTRVRSRDVIANRLRLPVLGRIHDAPRRVRKEGQILMLDAPDDPRAEAFRMLRMNLDFATFVRRPRTIMVTSAVAGEGKSVTSANLAVALARAGTSVALVDLDLRAGSLARLFRLEGHPLGLTSVALGRVTLDDALASVSLGRADRAASGRANGSRNAEGILQVLPSGPLPPNPGDFVAADRIKEILDELARRTEVVLVDTAPLLVAGDALALLRHVDAVMLVARLKVVRTHMLDELQEILETCPAAKLGVVVTGEKFGEAYGYGAYRRAQPRAGQVVDLTREQQGLLDGGGDRSTILGGETTRPR